ncbi:MAG: DUF4337 domain-containing protein [Chthoniobacteraceae bacterium]
MADVPELPEAKDSYERAIALSIAILAVILAFVDNTGDNAKTDAIVKTTAAANKWSYFQAKSIKGNLAENSAILLGLLTPVDPVAAKAKQEEIRKDVSRYDGEKQQLMADAQELEKQAAHSMSIDDRSDEAALVLQISVVVCSIAILVRWKPIFFSGLTIGVLGIAAAVRAFLS